MRLSRYPVDFLDGDLIYLVVDVEAGQVHSVREYNIYELVRCAVFTEQNLRFFFIKTAGTK